VLSLYQIDGTQPGWLSVAPWVIPPTDVRYNPALANGDAGSLETCEHGLVGGSGVSSGPCAENGYLAGAVIAELSLKPHRPIAESDGLRRGVREAPSRSPPS
jgi:hypothetical protein